jgi:hypothetical protein
MRKRTFIPKLRNAGLDKVVIRRIIEREPPPRLRLPHATSGLMIGTLLSSGGRVFLFERFARDWRLMVVLRVKPIFAVCGIALWLIGAMHCPLEAMGILPNDFCCWTTSAATDDPGESTKSVCSYEKSVCPWNSRAGDTTLAPIAIALSVVPPSMRPPSITVLESAIPGGEVSLLPQSWQFRWRAARAPRAPTFSR